MGVDPRKWGPPAWRLLHYLTLRYPDNADRKTRAAFARLFSALPAVLPCQTCKKHLRAAYARSPPVLKRGRAGLVRWMYNVHARVSRDLGKRTVRPPLARELPGIKSGWRAALPVFLLAVALGLRSDRFPARARDFVAGCRSVLGGNEVPSVAGVTTRAGFLAAVRRFYRIPESRARATFRGWTSTRNLERAFEGRGKPSASVVRRGSSSRSGRRV